MKNKWQYVDIGIKTGLIVAINIVLYHYNLFRVLEPKYIVWAVLGTSVLELLLFNAFFKRSRQVRMIQGAFYVLAIILKISAMLFFKQYGSYDIFSRMGQAIYLVNVTDYIVDQISFSMMAVCVLSLVYGFLLVTNPNGDRTVVEGKKKVVLIALLILTVGSWFVGPLRHLEIYRASTGSLYAFAFGSDESKVLEEANPAANAGAAKEVKPSARNLFENYGHYNRYTGIGAGKNLLIIQVESLQDNFIGKHYNGKEITPNLNRLIEKSFYFNDYFELLGFGNSSDAEYVSLHSTFSNTKKGAYEEYKDTDAYGLPKIAADKGYHTFSAHGNTGEFYHRSERHPGIGFAKVYMGEDFEQDEIIGMGLSDASMFRQMMPEIEKAYKNGKFMGFFITLTCHGPFDMPERNMVFEVPDELKNSTFAKYLNAVYYTDQVLGDFLDELERKGILKDTVVAVYGDHHAFANVDQEDSQHLTDFIGKPFDFDEMMRIPLIVYVPGYEKAILRDNVGSQIDFLPTICNIMGWNDVVTPMFGVDLLDDDLSRDNIVFPQTYMLQGSFITDDEMFEKSRILDGISGRLIDRKTRRILPEGDAAERYNASFEIIKEAQEIYYHNKVREKIGEFEK